MQYEPLFLFLFFYPLDLIVQPTRPGGNLGVATSIETFLKPNSISNIFLSGGNRERPEIQLCRSALVRSLAVSSHQLQKLGIDRDGWDVTSLSRLDICSELLNWLLQ